MECSLVADQIVSAPHNANIKLNIIKLNITTAKDRNAVNHIIRQMKHANDIQLSLNESEKGFDTQSVTV